VVDDGFGRDGGRRTLARRTGRKRGGIGIEAEADLAAALRDRGREPVGEGLGQAQPPLTVDLSPAPAENFGTLPPGIVIRSPVRGFTP
jgi:hypothetical protein